MHLWDLCYINRYTSHIYADLTALAQSLPQMYNVVKVALRLLYYPMPSELIASLGAMSKLESLSIENPHLNPGLDTIPDLTCLNALQCLVLIVSVSEYPPGSVNNESRKNLSRCS